MQKSLIDCTELTDQEKKLFNDFLLSWGCYYYFNEDNTFMQWSSAIREILGIEKEEFIKQMNEFKTQQNVADLLKNQAKYGKRPLTIQEIVAKLSCLSENSVYQQLRNLKKWKEVKEFRQKVEKHEITFYSYKF